MVPGILAKAQAYPRSLTRQKKAEFGQTHFFQNVHAIPITFKDSGCFSVFRFGSDEIVGLLEFLVQGEINSGKQQRNPASIRTLLGNCFVVPVHERFRFVVPIRLEAAN